MPINMNLAKKTLISSKMRLI